MPDSFDRLSSPAFYIYPPLTFWIDAVVSVVTANVLPVVHRLALVFVLIQYRAGLAIIGRLDCLRCRTLPSTECLRTRRVGRVYQLCRITADLLGRSPHRR